MEAQRLSKLLLFVFDEVGLVKDVQYIIVRLYFERVVYRSMWTNTGVGSYIDPITKSATKSGELSYINPQTNLLTKLDGSTGTKPLLSIGNHSQGVYYLDFQGRLDWRDGPLGCTISDNFRCVGCNETREFGLTVEGKLNMMDLFGTKDFGVTITETVYKLVITDKCIYWLTNRGEVYCYGMTYFSNILVRDPLIVGKGRLLLTNIIDMAANSYQEVIITTDCMLHTRRGRFARTIHYGARPQLKDTYKIRLQDRYIIFHSGKHTYICETYMSTLTIKSAYRALDIIWDQGKPIMDQNGQPLIEVDITD